MLRERLEIADPVERICRNQRRELVLLGRTVGGPAQEDLIQITVVSIELLFEQAEPIRDFL